MQTKTLEILEKRLTPNTLGLIWFSANSLETRPPAFEELDYFLDGLLTRTTELNSNQNSEHYFIKTTQFARPFYLVYLNQDQNLKKLNSLLEQDLKLMENKKESEILLLNAPGHINFKPLAQKLKLKINDLNLENELKAP
jgi:hypothetical protein